MHSVIGSSQLTLARARAWSPDHRQADPADDLAEAPAAAESDLLPLALFPELGQWQPTLARLRVPLAEAAVLAAAARRAGTDFQAELLLSGRVTEQELLQALSAELGLACAGTFAAGQLIADDRLAQGFLRRPDWRIPVKLSERDGSTSFLISSDRLEPGTLKRMLARSPALRARLKLVGAARLRSALLARLSPALARAATGDLFDRMPQLSARIVANAWQGALLGSALVALPVLLALAPAQTWFALHAFFSLFFFGCVALRFAAVRSAAPHRALPIRPCDEADMPVFSVLVALYRESEIVPDLLRSLEALVWPRGKLDIKLVCEADDHDTLAALARCRPGRHVEILAVPGVGPRTKPKALAYALPLARGEFVVLFDAEDRPDPLQLVQAWQRFQDCGEEVACLQAPLEVTNGGVNDLALMFAFEYATLFRGLLPWLARRGLVLPLGGTSNYFRRAVLEEIGGWDPYNVTEDADLGVRLRRFGYRCETITRPTYEEAPETIRDWLPQRTRWFKGFLQTWLVHMRDPVQLFRQLGPASFLIVQILFAGMVLSALVYPVLVVSLVSLLVVILHGEWLGFWAGALFAIDAINIVCGFLSFLMLGRQVLGPDERRRFAFIMALTPVYWSLLSVAAWRAVLQLARRPHVWEKTPHARPRA